MPFTTLVSYVLAVQISCKYIQKGSHVVYNTKLKWAIYLIQRRDNSRAQFYSCRLMPLLNILPTEPPDIPPETPEDIGPEKPLERPPEKPPEKPPETPLNLRDNPRGREAR